MKVMKQGRFDCFFGHDCIDLPQPAMCLRGGGADAKRKEARKRKFGHLPNQHSHGDETTGTAIGEHDTEPPVKRQERKRLKSESEGPKPLPASAEARDLVDEQSSAQSAERETFEKKQRFIIFIGNLPFTTTTDSITQHFAKVQPSSIRHRTQKDTGRSKGFAFLEFDGYDRMKTCLKLYHHSNFDDGVSPTRKINVELTAGGGGAKSKERKEKLQAKNEKLNEERKRRALEEEKQSRKAKKKEQSVGVVAVDDSDIHPSRRGRVPTA
ncbi:MAG: hypothetical protein LQ347_000318 [Umbilicaria vellea]|nr:MAG: hypothetical protein LQ347_000318 [Umbilicaria vellea]